MKIPGLQLPRGIASLLWQSTESFNSRQRAHDGSGPMGFKRINIQVTASRGASWGTALWIGEKGKTKQNNLNVVYHIKHNMHAQ